MRTEIAYLVSIGIAALSITSIGACNGSNSEDQLDEEDASAQSDRNAAERIEAVFEAYLSGSVATAESPVSDTLLGCDVYWASDRWLALARYSVMGVAQHGDTAVGTVEVVSTALLETPTHGEGLLVKPGVRTDTLSWYIVNAAGRWGVCGYSREGYGFAHVRRLPATTRWPEGFSLRTLLLITDSVARSSGTP
jgi:hypothetical protein